MTKFDPNAAALPDSGIFGLPTTAEEARLVYVPIPWEATTSYGGGTSEGPAAILEASRQVDLFDLEVEKPYEAGLHMVEAPSDVRAWNERARGEAKKIIEAAGVVDSEPLRKSLATVNELSARVNERVYEATKHWLERGKVVAIVGGDHSVPFGAFQAMAERHPEGYGILHFDAHSDTRDAYEGFAFSHASIMHNALSRIPQIRKLVQVGIRDFCEEEVEYCVSQGERAKIHFDAHLARRKFEGESWAKIAQDIVAGLPEKVWISFDIDGLDPRFCPHTGTPVPGGLDFQEACYVVGALARSGRKIIGFDLNEVAPHPEGADEWDANVGARLLYKLTAWTLASQGLAKLRD
jgi:agmatinase